jgi:hypothetical protein
MTGDDRAAVKRLETMPNIGPAMARDLIRLGIASPDHLIGRDGDELYDELCRLDGLRHDPCVQDTFNAAVAFANGGPPLPWWSFTAARKERNRAKQKG